MSNSDWYKAHNCDHAHCPNECEHPQPFIYADELICGRCAVLDDTLSKMIPCTPETCKD